MFRKKKRNLIPSTKHKRSTKMTNNSWKVGLLGCMSDMTACIDNTCCVPCMIGRQRAATNDKINEQDMISCALSLCFAPCCTFLIRQSVVSKFNIDESIVHILCLGCVCSHLSMCQTHNELTAQKLWPGGACLHKSPPQIAM